MANLFTCNFGFLWLTEIHTFAYVQIFFFRVFIYHDNDILMRQTKNKRKFMTINSIEMIESLIVWSFEISSSHQRFTVWPFHILTIFFFNAFERDSKRANRFQQYFLSRIWVKTNTFIMMFAHFQFLMSANWYQIEIVVVVAQCLSFGERYLNFVKATEFIWFVKYCLCRTSFPVGHFSICH